MRMSSEIECKDCGTIHRPEQIKSGVSITIICACGKWLTGGVAVKSDKAPIQRDNKDELMEDMAVCLEDCLVRIFPEEFKPQRIREAAERFSGAGGTIARISGLVEKAKEMI